MHVGKSIDHEAALPERISMDLHDVYKHLWRLFKFRERRMKRFIAHVGLTNDSAVLDLGGTAATWTDLSQTPNITLVNTDSSHEHQSYGETITFRTADACNLDYEDGHFDIVFSNSVIEHVGDRARQEAFAAEARRVAPKLWVQTPSPRFFLEPHLLTPLVHWFPRSTHPFVFRYLTVWGIFTRPSAAEVEHFIRSTRLLKKRDMEQLFPDCQIITERWLGMPKSYIAVRS